MRILITGGAGFIGRHLVRAFRLRNYEVGVVDNLIVPPIIDPSKDIIKKSVADLCPSFVSQFDIVVHLAALKSIPQSFQSDELVFQNMKADYHMFRIFGESDASKLYFSSSCEVYGNRPGELLSEHSSTEPQSPYAVGKLTSEKFIKVNQLLYPHKKFCIMRLFNTYGVDEGQDAVIPRFIFRALRGEPIYIEGNGYQKRDFTYIEDTVKYIVALVEKSEPPPVINIGSGCSWQILELVNNLKLFMALDFDVQFVESRVNEIDEFRADVRLLKEETKHINILSFQKGLEQMVHLAKDFEHRFPSIGSVTQNLNRFTG